MCRGKNKEYCTELGQNPTKWDKNAPLLIPKYFEKELDIFQQAVETLVLGDHAKALSYIEQLQDREMKQWYIEHGQMSGRHRYRALGKIVDLAVDKENRHSVRSPSALEEDVFERDGYRCRYCGNRVLSKNIIKQFINTLNSPKFSKGKTNNETHGLILIFRPCADHVTPWRKGGRTDMDNLVTSCGPCNYGKDGFSLKQLGLNEPNKNYKLGAWDGLNEHAARLK